MIRLLGAGLLLLGGAGTAQAALCRRRCELQTVEELLTALHRMESAVSCERRPLYPLFDALSRELGGEGGRFFRALLAMPEPERALAADWVRCAEALPLPPEGLRLWRELGGRLGGDAESVTAAIAQVCGELTALHHRMAQAMPEQRRVWTALALSASAFLVVLLL